MNTGSKFSLKASPDLTWESPEQCIYELAKRHRLIMDDVRLAAPAASAPDDIQNRIDDCADHLGIEAEPVCLTYGDAETVLRRVAPFVVRASESELPRFWAVLRCNHDSLLLLLPDLSVQRVSARKWIAALREPLEIPHAAGVDALLDSVGVPPSRRGSAYRVLMAQHLNTAAVTQAWHLRPTPAAPLWQQVKRAHIPQLMVLLLALYTLTQMAFIASWVALAAGIFNGAMHTGWLIAWVLLLFTQEFLRLVTLQIQAVLQVDTYQLFWWRQVHGAMKLSPDEIKHQGIGQLLGRVIEANKFEGLFRLDGGARLLMGVIEMGLGAVVLLTSGITQLSAFVVMICVVTAAVAYAHFRNEKRTTITRRRLTHELVEKLIGYRTRLVQENPTRWHADEDRSLAEYLPTMRKRDESQLVLSSGIERIWLAGGLSIIALCLLNATTTMQMAIIAIGGVLLVSRSLTKITAGTLTLIEIAVAAREIHTLVEAATRRLPTGTPEKVRADSATVMQVNNMVFSRGGNRVIDGLSLKICHGDRIVLEGESGSGKSTLTTLLAGLNTPDHGVLLYGGSDLHTIGAKRWQQGIVIVPQFHENHVFAETFAFNALMGRTSQPTVSDLREALSICNELGLTPLLERMPGGLFQVVGESGWQLSHGERSRLYIARALLQGGDLTILDESIAALDPDTMQTVIDCVTRRAKTLLVVAHL
jgi:ATP-binding cassette, subfamily B, bacterial